MASKPEKRIASSVFITLAPPRRHEAVAEEVRRAACEARPGRTRESSAPMKAAGAGSAERPSLWTAPGRAAAPVPAVPPQLSNGGKRVGSGQKTRSEAALRWEGKGRLGSFILSSIKHLMCQQTLEPACLGSNPGSLTAWLCDVGKSFNLSIPQCPNL